MNIIKAEQKDIPHIKDIAEKSWRANYRGILSDEQIEYMLNMMYSEEALAKDFENENYQYHLIFSPENIFVGILGFEISYEPYTTKLHRIYLLKETKGKGFGKMAIDFLKSEVIKTGNKRIILNVNKENPAIKFYESQGFTMYREGIFDIGDGFVMDDYLMEFNL